jgi:Uma2 family endonuclease
MATASYQFTVDDLANTPDDGNRYEVIDGELYVSSAPNLAHQFILNRIDHAFGAWYDAGGDRYGLPLPGSGVIFAFNSGVIPDFLWVSNEQLPAILIDPKTGKRDGKLHAAPDLTVEILSAGRANEERDREFKLKLYSTRGVREYWIIDRFRRLVLVYRRTPAAALALAATLRLGDTLTSPLLPDLALPVDRLVVLPPAIEGDEEE